MAHAIVTKLEPGETVVLIRRAHWIVPLKIILTALVLFAVPLGVYQLIVFAAPALLDHTVARPILLLLTVTYTLAVWLFSFTDFIDYFLDVWILTSGRVLNIEQHGLFRRTASELNLSSIQDVTAETKGILQTFFKFGDVFVQTAAEHERFHMKQIARPDEMKMKIMELSEKDRIHEQGVGTPAKA
ncbi:PH domain-containing protein [Candidatus Uhrbacteria bacterium]|nr:PH domain-containing protein [Candidatus Uhrbacteria bacterium]